MVDEKGNCKEYIDGPSDKRGRKRMISDGSKEMEAIERLLADHQCMKMYLSTKQFHQDFYPNFCDKLPSISTVNRAVASNNTLKNVDRINC